MRLFYPILKIIFKNYKWKPLKGVASGVVRFGVSWGSRGWKLLISYVKVF